MLMSKPITREPLNLLKKSELLWLMNHYCKHRMPYISHLNCFYKEEPVEERIGILDIESGGSLTAEFGYTFSWALKEFEGEVISDVVTSKEIRDSTKRDKRILINFCRIVKTFDTLIVYYGMDKKWRHDFPFLRTRCLKWGIEDFPIQREKRIIDIYDIAKTKLKLAHTRQIDVARILGIMDEHGYVMVHGLPFIKYEPVIPDVWQNALSGSTVDLERIQMHNIADVYMLEEITKRLLKYKGNRLYI